MIRFMAVPIWIESRIVPEGERVMLLVYSVNQKVTKQLIIYIKNKEEHKKKKTKKRDVQILWFLKKQLQGTLRP